MNWRVWGKPFLNASELSDTTFFCPFTPKKNLILSIVRTWVIIYNDPTFTDLNMKLYGDDGGSPGKLIATSSDSRTKAELLTTEDNALKGTYFNFDNIPLQAETLYHLVINGTGYSPTSSKYLAWKQAFPDPVYPDGFTVSMEGLNQAPFDIEIIGGEY